MSSSLKKVHSNMLTGSDLSLYASLPKLDQPPGVGGGVTFIFLHTPSKDVALGHYIRVSFPARVSDLIDFYLITTGDCRRRIGRPVSFL
jgi:hypothetical protein